MNMGHIFIDNENGMHMYLGNILVHIVGGVGGDYNSLM